MNAPATTTPTCPECGATDTMVGASGNGLCFACNATWDPENVVAIPRPEPRPSMEVDENPATGDMELMHVGPERDYTTELVGGPVILEGGQRGIAVGFPDDDHVEVELGDGRHETVDFADVQSIGPPPLVAPPATDAVSDADQDAYAQMVQLTASLLVKAAVASVDTSGDEWHVDATPEGFVPAAVTPFHVLEQAGVMALVSLIVMFKIDPGLIIAGIDGAAHAATEGDQPEVTE